MKKYIAILVCIFFACFNLFGEDAADTETQNEMPPEMANSILLLRNGVDDLHNVKVGAFFLGKTFKSNTQLDGTKATAQYGTAKLEGNTFSLPIEFYTNDKLSGVFTFYLIYSGDSTLLQKIEIKDIGKGVSQVSDDFLTKAKILAMLGQAWEK